MPFVKGQSGNPAGRPPKDRALTEILEKAGNKTLIVGDKKVSRSKFLANAIWQAVTEKHIDMPDGTQMDVGPDDWWDAVQFIYKHIDGPPKQAVDLTSGGEKLPPTIVKVGIDPDKL